MLRNAKEAPTVELYPRSDGPGSSLDLPQFQAMGTRIWLGEVALDDEAWKWSNGSLRTLGACIDCDPVRFRAVPSSRENEVEYFAPDFHDKPITTTEIVPGLPELFVNNILVQFGLFGVRIEADPMPAVYRGTGLGGSNLAHAAALILVSALSGADLSLPQLYVWGTFLENNFGVRRITPYSVAYGVSLTGGQEMLTAFQGGLADNVHLPFLYGPHAVLSRELVAPEQYDELSRHLALVNLGNRRADGATSRSVNTDWIAAWAIPEQATKHLRKAVLAYEGAEALRLLDFHVYADVIRTYREIRTELCTGYTAGLGEMKQLCDQFGCQYFPVGAGGGTCLVCAPQASFLTDLLAYIKGSEDPSVGRIAIPLRIRRGGIGVLGFEELELAIPAGAPELAR
jgi:hypothetical protein